MNGRFWLRGTARRFGRTVWRGGVQQNSVVPYYNHNDHYTGLLLRQVPRPCGAALDVGCGEGRLLARLAGVSDVVVGIDPDAASVDAARKNARSAELIRGDFLERDFVDESFDMITAVASVHHMPLSGALEKMARLLRPGGVIAILGLYCATTLADRAVELVAIPVNAALAWSRPSALMTAPAMDPTMPLRDIRSTAAQVLPGATTRRLLLWRYLLTWSKSANV